MRIAVAMSGGVDSSTAAALLVEQGHEVVGLTLKLWESSRCCSLEDVDDARRASSRLGIPFFVLDAHEAFEAEVVRPFVEAYARGLTPNPCILCNRRIKFRWLLGRARALGCAALATGHYARLVRTALGQQLLRGVDARKDQSYFLVPEHPADLEEVLFPLGALDKSEVRRMAAERAVPVAEKPESQDVCFVGLRGLARFLEERLGRAEPGEVVDPEGRVLGEHRGMRGYTVGQRKGLGIASKRPLYVVKKEIPQNRLVLGPREALEASGLTASCGVWLGAAPAEDCFECEVKIRSTAPPVACEVERARESVRVRFEEPQFGVAPGQMAVFYRGDCVLGGAWIEGALAGVTLKAELEFPAAEQRRNDRQRVSPWRRGIVA